MMIKDGERRSKATNKEREEVKTMMKDGERIGKNDDKMERKEVKTIIKDGERRGLN